MPKKAKVFVITNLCYTSIFAALGEYSIIKSNIADDYGYDDQFMGLIDLVQLVGVILSSLVIIFLNVKPNEGCLKFTVLNFLAAGLLFVVPYIQNQTVETIIIFVSLFLHCMTYSRMVFSQLIFNHYFDVEKEKCYYSVWFALSYLGPVIGVAFTEALQKYFNLKWNMINLIFFGVLLALNFLQYLAIPEIQSQNAIDTIKKIKKSTEGAQDQEMNLCQELRLLVREVWKFVRVTRNWVLVVDIGICGAMDVNIMFWLPYYNNRIGNEDDAALIAMLLPLGLMSGGFLVQVLIFERFVKAEKARFVHFGLVFLGWLVMGFTKYYSTSHPQSQMYLLPVFGFLVGCPFSRVNSSEPQEVCENEKDVLLSYLSSYFLRDSINLLSLYAIGFFMERSTQSFYFILWIHMSLILLMAIIRRIVLHRRLLFVGVREKLLPQLQ